MVVAKSIKIVVGQSMGKSEMWQMNTEGLKYPVPRIGRGCNGCGARVDKSLARLEIAEKEQTRAGEKVEKHLVPLLEAYIQLYDVYEQNKSAERINEIVHRIIGEVLEPIYMEYMTRYGGCGMYRELLTIFEACGILRPNWREQVPILVNKWRNSKLDYEGIIELSLQFINVPGKNELVEVQTIMSELKKAVEQNSLDRIMLNISRIY